jgi:hypothetical protein
MLLSEPRQLRSPPTPMLSQAPSVKASSALGAPIERAEEIFPATRNLSIKEGASPLSERI